MELEKTLYRIHDRILSGHLTSKIIRYASFFFVGIAILGIMFLIILNMTTRSFNPKDQNGQSVELNEDIVYIFNVTDQEMRSNNMSYLSMKYAKTKSLLLMKNEIQEKYNFTTVTLFLDSYDYIGGLNYFFTFATDIETMFLIDFMRAQSTNNISLQNIITNETWFWDSSFIADKNNIDSFFKRIYNQIWLLGKCILGLFLASVVASIYIKMTIICAPVLIVMMIECMKICGNPEIQPAVLARAFPWVGYYLQILDRNNKPKKELQNSFAFMLILFYFVYLCSVFSGSLLLFDKSFPNGMSEDFFGLIAINEFSSMLFLRTRTSLYFLPKFIILINVMFLYYFQSTVYGYYYLAFEIQFFLTLGIYCFFLTFIETPALTWSPVSPYTPSFDRPRVYYCPLFNMNWVTDTPQFWTMFYPLYGRKYFSSQQLSLVDKNFPLLNHYLQQEQEMVNLPIIIGQEAPIVPPHQLL